jgi:hypothetical protein
MMMADNPLLNDNNDGVGGGEDIFVYVGGEQEVPRDVKRVCIAENVDTIPERTFLDRQQLIEVEGHVRLKKIERHAFANCRSLRRATKMQGVLEIERSAFNHCIALSELEFDKLEIIGPSAFAYCRCLRSINMPSVRRVGDSAFSFCRQLTDAVFGEKLERIEQYIVNGCTALRRIVIPLKDNILFDNYAFNYCGNLSRVDTLAGEIHENISSLHLKTWRHEMEEEIDRINQTLPNVPSATLKAEITREWIARVLSRMEHYKGEHKMLLKEAMTLLELALWKANLHDEAANDADAQEGVRVTRGQRKRARKDRCITSGASIVIKNVLPFLALK